MRVLRCVLGIIRQLMQKFSHIKSLGTVPRGKLSIAKHHLFSNYSRGQRKSVQKTVGGTAKGPKSTHTPGWRLTQACSRWCGLGLSGSVRPAGFNKGTRRHTSLWLLCFYEFEATSSTPAPRSVLSQGSHTQSWRYLTLNSQDVKSLCPGFHQRKISQAQKKKSHKCHTQMFMNFIIVLLFFFWQNRAF